MTRTSYCLNERSERMACQPSGIVKVSVQLVGMMCGTAGTEHIDIELKNELTVTSLLNTLAKRLGSEFQKATIDSELGDPRPNVLILVNGREIGLLKGLDTTLEDKDVVTILPVSHGG